MNKLKNALSIVILLFTVFLCGCNISATPSTASSDTSTTPTLTEINGTPTAENSVTPNEGESNYPIDNINIPENMILVNETDDDKTPLFRLGLSLNDAVTILESNSINNYDITEIAKDEKSWEWGNTAINVLIYSNNYQFLFDKKNDELYCINISGDKATELSSTQSGLKLGDTFDQMVQLYGHDYSVYETEDGSSIYEYKIGNNYFYVEFLFDVVYRWGISEYRYNKT